MTRRRTVYVSLLLTLAVWTLFSWPLPRHLFSGIPCSARTTEKVRARTMIAGDHLQLLYHFWLFQDMALGQTRLFHNLYEFNTGDDDERYAPGTYFAPSSVIFTAGSLVGGRAFGWNFASFLSLWLTCLFTWLLARRYTKNEIHAVTAGVVSILLPYPWITLFGGSPTGFAIMWVPLLLLGIDIAVRDERITGGILASAALIFACGGDTHVFFFCALMTPLWGIIALIGKEDFRWSRPLSYLRLVRPLSPILLAVIVAVGYQHAVKQHLAGSKMAAGRDLSEVGAFSPTFKGLFMWEHLGISNQVYIGYTIPIILIAGWLVLLKGLRNRQGREWKPVIIFTALCLGILGIVVLSLGPNGPFHGKAFLGMRRIIPHYDKIRQAGKIFCLMPSCLGLAVAMALSLLSRVETRRHWHPGIFTLAALLCILEYRLQISPMVCVLDKEQSAYRAVSEDADRNNHVSRALALPLWPGDSHWSSLYQHYGSLYRIRMVNGYSPIVKNDYFQDIFLRFESANAGEFSDGQLDELRQRGIHHIILHEDAFPEKVSAFPVGFTLKKLLNHPRLKLLEQSERVWAFGILSSPEIRAPAAPGWNTFFPAKRWEAEQCAKENCEDVQDPTAGRGFAVSMRDRKAVLQIKRPVGISSVPDLAWMLRVRGMGTVLYELMVNESPRAKSFVMIGSDKWTWISIPVTGLQGFSSISFKLGLTDGWVDVDMILLMAGTWRHPARGESVALPAPTFFHAGYTDLENDSVVFRRETEPDKRILYGPFLPLPVGKYEAQFIFISTSPAYSDLGTITVFSGDECAGTGIVSAGRLATCVFTQKENLPVSLYFNYSRAGDLKVSQIVFLRLE